jgi:hypothetical protein
MEFGSQLLFVYEEDLRKILESRSKIIHYGNLLFVMSTFLESRFGRDFLTHWSRVYSGHGLQLSPCLLSFARRICANESSDGCAATPAFGLYFAVAPGGGPDF